MPHLPTPRMTPGPMSARAAAEVNSWIARVNSLVGGISVSPPLTIADGYTGVSIGINQQALTADAAVVGVTSTDTTDGLYPATVEVWADGSVPGLTAGSQCWAEDPNGQTLSVQNYNAVLLGTHSDGLPVFSVQAGADSGGGGGGPGQPVTICGQLFLCCYNQPPLQPAENNWAGLSSLGTGASVVNRLTAAPGGSTLTGMLPEQGGSLDPSGPSAVRPADSLDSPGPAVVGFINAGPDPVTFAHLSSSSAPDNQFNLAPSWQGTGLTLNQDDSAVFYYDVCGAQKQWRLMATSSYPTSIGPPGGGGGGGGGPPRPPITIRVPTYFNGPVVLCGCVFWCCLDVLLGPGDVGVLAFPGCATVYRLFADGGGGGSLSTVGGIAPADDGQTTVEGVNTTPLGPQVICLINAGGAPIFFPNMSDGLSDTDILAPGPGSAGFTLNPNDAVILWWDICQWADDGTGVWRVLAGTYVFGPAGEQHSTGWVPDPGPTPHTPPWYLGDDGAWHPLPLDDCEGTFNGPLPRVVSVTCSGCALVVVTQIDTYLCGVLLTSE